MNNRKLNEITAEKCELQQRYQHLEKTMKEATLSYEK